MWRGIVGKGFTPETFEVYASAMRFGAWRPSFVVVHNTSTPTLATYRSWRTRAKPITGEQWLKNLEGYYRDQMHWSAGPHLFVGDDRIWAFTPLNVPGTHSPSWNSTSWGVETVGDYQTEPFDPKVKVNLVAALVMLHHFGGLDPDHLRFHKEDPRTTHKDCPGKNMSKVDLIVAVKSEILRRYGGEHKTVPVNAHEVTAKSTKTRAIDPYMGWIIDDEGRGLEVRATEPGGAVNMGISMETFINWRRFQGKGPPTQGDLARITDEEVADIYEELYAKAIRLGSFPKGIGYCVLDAAINDGVGAARSMTRAVVGNPEGDWETLAQAAKGIPAGVFIMQFSERRMEHKRASPEWNKYHLGWSLRVDRVKARALALAKGG